MEITKNSHRNTWQAVHETTRAIREGRLDPALTDWLSRQGVRVETALFASVRQCDQRLYMGTLVDEKGRVLEYLANLDLPEDDALDDVTAELGPKCSYHHRHDPCDPVTMALMIQRGQAPALAAQPA
ncbi:hypothetical protein [Alloalcanivorax venustensis]|jgi:hypothetical protein|uniref:hypothetical protein n=1 Tax=Alloalcanivorax venustensis TaxID=172371 RepID=UPI0035199A40|tara:strand:- start:12112 stop:12492 length:381 start_codon:yes stop_codon:yes gene_type:complete